MSDLLSIGATGVRAYQSALTTVGENIANTGVAGYSRRTATLAEVGTTGGVGGRTMAGNGVVVTGVTRAADVYRATALRQAGTDLARTESGSVWLDRIQTALTGPALGGRLTSFFTAAQRLAADPSAIAQRTAVLESAGALASAFAATGQSLDQAAAELDGTGEQAAATLDALGTALAGVNDGLARAPAGSANAAQLADRRDQILDQMSAIADVSVQTDPIGRATVTVGGPTGPVLVAGTESGHVGFLRDAGGAVALSVTRAGVVSGFVPTGGALAGVIEGAGRIADARRSLDALATTFVAEMNGIQAGGRDLDGKPGAPLFAVGATATDVTVTLVDPRGLAAAGVGGGVRDGSNLVVLERARTAHGWETALTTQVAGNAAALQQRRVVADAQGTIRDGAVAAQASASGVDLDKEAVELLRFQQAYQASSRVIQVARDTLQSILEIR